MSNEFSEHEAREIVQDFLDRQGAAALSGDLEEIVRWCDFPCTLESPGQRVNVTDKTMLRSIAEAFVEQVTGKRVTHIVRRCLEASFHDEDTVTATYETRFVRDGQMLSEDPYVSFVVLRRGKDRWRFSNMQFDVAGDSPASIVLRDWNMTDTT
ncbi:hypothetical protein AB9K34_15800 [Sedimentitalea sp. XS_ASV28]|uniref:hypothetical protein n=1 Tax=Sedimentitalea sp. XS_ASV28 TaxID=3241296 RepID=UPI0035187BF3